MKHQYLHSRHSCRISMMLAMLLTTLGLSSQTLQIHETVNSDKAAPVTGSTINALQGSGSVTYSFTLTANVSAIKEAYYELDNERHQLSWTIDELGDKAVFSTTATVDFAQPGMHDALKATVTYSPYSENATLDDITVDATAQHDVHVWPLGSVTYTGPTPTWGILSGTSTPLAASVTGGYENGWQYSWSTGAKSNTINYTSTNTTGSIKHDTPSVTVKNIAPDGTSVWQEFTNNFDVAVYPTPSANAQPINPSSVVFAGTKVSLAVTTSGGNPDGWNYNWAGTESNGQPTTTFTATNSGTTAVNHIPTLTLINQSPDGTSWYNESLSFPVTVWPVANATLTTPERTLWFDGETIQLTMNPTGGDASKWTYQWTVDGQNVTNNSATYNYTTVNTGNAGATHTIAVTATNAPDGIDAAKVITQSYTFTVYPRPSITSLNADKTVIYSGTTVNLEGILTGGNPDGWTYQWTQDGTPVGGNSTKLTVTPDNTGTSAKTINYNFSATNNCGGNIITVVSNCTVTVWPVANASLTAPGRTEWINGELVPLTMNTTGGDASNWTYSWTVDGQNVSNNSATYNYTALNNGNEAVTRTITVKATNTPDGIDIPKEVTQSYTCTVYPTPQLSSFTANKSAVYSGTAITFTGTVTGGNPDGWTYSWTRNGTPLEHNSTTLTVTPENTSSSPMTIEYTLIAINKCGDYEISLSQSATVTVWPVANATLNTPGRTEWLNGENVPLNLNISGGDSSKWTYRWTVDGQSVTDSSSAFNYIAINNGNEPATRTIVVTATNTPDGIDKPYTISFTYVCTVYGTPSVSDYTIDKSVIYSGTPVQLSSTVTGGKPNGWVYAWSQNGTSIDNSGRSLSITPTNNSNDKVTYTYSFTAVNTVDDQIKTFTHDYVVTVWPTPSATISAELPADVLSGDQITIPVSTSGGDAGSWNFKWTIDGREVQNSSDPVFDYTAINPNDNSSVSSTVSVIITNSPDGIDAEYTANYSHTFIVWPAPTAVSILDDYQVTCSHRTLTLGVTTIGGQSSNWTFSWTHNGTPISHNEATMPVTFENNTASMKTDTYTVTSTNIVNGEVRYNNTVSYTVDIYPEPKTTQGQSSFDSYYNYDVNMTVNADGGYPTGWKYEWSDNLPANATVTYTVPSSNDSSYKKTITLTVSNGYGDTVWSRTTYTYEITCWSTGEVTPVTVLANDYNGNINLTLETTTHGGFTSGWTYEWYLNGSLQSDGTSNLDINETNYNELVETYNWELIATNTLNGVVGYTTRIPFTYNLWPVIETPSAFEVSNENVRNGSTIALNVVPAAATGGYMYTWNYNWTADGIKIDNNNPVISYTVNIDDDSSLAYKDIVFGLNLNNVGPNGSFWFNEDYPTRTVRVYNRPVTPTALERKGNGTTGTMIVLTDLTDAQLTATNYMFVFGYTDAMGVDHAMPAVAERYYRFTNDVYNNSANNFWVYAVWNYTNGVSVTSCRRYLNGTTDDFDGSDFGTTGRGDAAGLDGITVDDNEIYVDSRGFIINLDTPSAVTVRLINTAGSIVFTNKYPASNSFNERFGNTRLTPGIYIISVETETSAKFKKVVIK